MAKHAIELRHCSTFGMDMRARTTTVKGIDGSTGATATRRFDDAPAPSEIALWMQGEFAGPWYAANESGCTGFRLCREPRALGIDCDVVAATGIARSDADKKRKNDRRVNVKGGAPCVRSQSRLLRTYRQPRRAAQVGAYTQEATNRQG